MLEKEICNKMSVLSTPHDEIKYNHNIIQYWVCITSRESFTINQVMFIGVEKSDDFIHP